MPIWRIALVATVVVIAFSGAMLVYGSRLPREHVASVHARYVASPAAIWRLVADPMAAPTWRDVTRVEKLPPVGGNEAWREVTGSDSIDFVATTSVQERSRVARILNVDLGYGGQWETELTPTDRGTDVTITERGYVESALFRVVSKHMIGHTANLEKYHRSLARALREDVTLDVEKR